MKRWLCALVGCVLISSFAVTAGFATAESAPVKLVEDLVGIIRQIKESPEDGPPLTPEDLQNNQKLTREVSGMMDIEGLARYALWKHWDERSNQEREEFVSVLRQVLEVVAYPNTGEFLRDLTMSVRKEKTLNEKAMVYTSVVHEKEGRIDIDFKLEQLQGNWLLSDVYLDGVSLARNLRTRCQKIIRDESFGELMNRLRKKLEDEDSTEFDDITERG